MAGFRECAANESADSTSSKNRMPHRPPPSTLCAPFYTAPRGTEGRTPSRQVRRPTAEVTWRGCASLRSSGEYPAASIIVAAEQAKEPEDRTLILADVGRKAIWQVEHFVQELLERHMRPAQAKEAARILSTGTWTHDHPLLREELEALG